MTPRFENLPAVLRDGYVRVAAAPVVLAGAWLALLVTAVPFALALGNAIERDLGASTAAAAAAHGVNFDWWQEFSFRHPEHGRSFQPSIIGGGGPDVEPERVDRQCAGCGSGRGRGGVRCRRGPSCSAVP